MVLPPPFWPLGPCPRLRRFGLNSSLAHGLTPTLFTYKSPIDTESRWREKHRVHRVPLVNVGIVESDPRPRLEPSPHDFGPSRPVPNYA